MTDELVKRLRKDAEYAANGWLLESSTKAADAIEQQAARIAKLEAALGQIAEFSPAITHGWAIAVRHIARAALENTDEQ